MIGLSKCPAHTLQDGHEGGSPELHARVADVHLGLLRDEMPQFQSRNEAQP